MSPHLEELDALIAKLERWWTYARSRRHAPRRRRAVTPASRQHRKTPHPTMHLRWSEKGLEVDTTCWCRVYLYETTRRVSPWSAARERVVYAELDARELATVARWIAENPGPPGWGGYRPAVRIEARVYALDYNQWTTLGGWT